MPIVAPNRIADPAHLESYEAPCALRQEGGLFIPFKNTTADKIYLAGEPVVMFGRVCIVQKTILPGKKGTLIADWIVDAIIKSGGAGNIAQDALVYWDTDEDVITELETGVVGVDIGAVSNVVPTNGFILGRAVVTDSDDEFAATATSKRVKVVAIPGAPTVYSG